MIDKQSLITLLNKNFNIDTLEVTDDSSKHNNHPESIKSGGGHFSIYIVSEDFNGKNLVNRHRMIYDCLKDTMGKDIHALAIKAKTQAELNI